MSVEELDQIIGELSDRPGNAEIVSYLASKRAIVIARRRRAKA